MDTQKLNFSQNRKFFNYIEKTFQPEKKWFWAIFGPVDPKNGQKTAILGHFNQFFVIFTQWYPYLTSSISSVGQNSQVYKKYVF